MDIGALIDETLERLEGTGELDPPSCERPAVHLYI